MIELFRRLSEGTARTRPAKSTFRPGIETLEARDVPSATPVDLSFANAPQQDVNGVIFSQTDTQPTGTGVIQSFVRVQGTGGAKVAQGVNTDARPLLMDENKSPVFTHSLQLGDIPVVQINGTLYREFLLDINQKASSPNLSLDEVRIFVGTSGNLNYNAATQTVNGQSAVYDLDLKGDEHTDNYIKLNASLNHGSGSGDMFMYVPDTMINNGNGTYLYLYSKFGLTIASNGGFEEWAVRSSKAGPQLSTLSGFVYADSDGSQTFNPAPASQTADKGIAGVTIILQGINDRGETVLLSTTTNENGFYSFDGLRAGRYTITEIHPDKYLAGGVENVGTVNGATDGSGVQPTPEHPNLMFANIMLPFGVKGVDYDFGHILDDSTPPPTVPNS